MKNFFAGVGFVTLFFWALGTLGYGDTVLRYSTNKLICAEMPR